MGVLGHSNFADFLKKFGWLRLSATLILLLMPEPVSAYRVIGVEERQDLTSEFGWRDSLAEVQRLLREFGLYRGPTDGRLNEQTRRAIDKYRQRNGVIDEETIWPSVVFHMRAISEAVRMQKSLKAARLRQIEEAKSRLETHAAGRDLVVRTRQRETADPTHDSSICFAAPTLECLLDEARESIRGISQDRYRNWALQDLIGVMAGAGLVEPMKAAVRSLTDARLILVSLREGVTSMALAGRMTEAEETVALMPDGLDRTRALLAMIKGWLKQGEKGAARELLERLRKELESNGNREDSLRFEAKAAHVFADAGEAGQTRAILANLSQGLDGLTETAMSEILSDLSVAYARIGETDTAEAFVNRIKRSADMRRSRMALAGAYADAQLVERVLQTVARMPVARYRVVALCDAARRLIEWNNIVEGRRALDQALKDTALVEGEFATEFAWACVAEVFGLLGDNDKAQEAVGHINGKDMKARTLWRLAQLPLNVGSSAGASLEEAAVLATEATDTFKRVAIWCEAATEADRRGESDLARERINRAIDIVANMKTRWWRARAISRIGAAFVTLETAATRR